MSQVSVLSTPSPKPPLVHHLVLVHHLFSIPVSVRLHSLFDAATLGGLVSLAAAFSTDEEAELHGRYYQISEIQILPLD
jgi:hypothetical protein